MRLFLTRHGKTLDNEASRIQGHLHGELSEKGLEQARKLAKRLKEENFDLIISSDLKRAVDTAKEISKFHPATKHILTKNFRERNMGEFQGIIKKDIKGFDQKTSLSMSDGIIKKGEEFQDFFNRAKTNIKELHEEHKGKKVLLVAHQGMNRMILTALMKKPAEFVRGLDSQKNTAVNIIDLSDFDNPKFLLLNCDKHLE